MVCTHITLDPKSYIGIIGGYSQVPWLASTATFRPPLNAGSMALGSMTCLG